MGSTLEFQLLTLAAPDPTSFTAQAGSCLGLPLAFGRLQRGTLPALHWRSFPVFRRNFEVPQTNDRSNRVETK